MREIELDGKHPTDLAASVCPEKEAVLQEMVVTVPILMDPAKCCTAEPGAATLGKEGAG